jgi:hypothetical protein
VCCDGIPFFIDNVVNIDQLQQALDAELEMNGFPPFELTVRGNLIMVRVNSLNVPEAEVRKMLNMSLGRQGRRLREG